MIAAGRLHPPPLPQTNRIPPIEIKSSAMARVTERLTIWPIVGRPSFASRGAALLRSALIGDFLSYFASKIVPGFMGLITVPVLIRLIGLDQYGRFAVIAPIMMAVAAVSSGWLAQGLLRFHPVAGDSMEREIAFDRAIITGTFATALLTAIALTAVLAGLHYGFLTALTSLAFCLSLSVYTIVLARFQAQLLPGAVLRREIVRSVGGFVIPVGLILITGRKQFEFVLLGQAIAYSIAFLPARRSLGYRPMQDAVLPVESAPSASFSTTNILRQLWGFGWAVGLWLLLSQFLPVIDRWTIQRFAGYSKAGVYASLYEIAVRSLSFLVYPLTQAAHPRIMRAWNEGRFATASRIIRHSMFYQLLIFAAVLGGVLMAAPRITRMILGFDDSSATRMLPILLIGGFLWQFALLLHKPLEIAQRTGAMLAAMAAAMVFNIIACFQLIPRFGYQAASYILGLSACAYIVITLCLTGFGAVRNVQPLPEPQGEFSD
jgi:O-antigen/teichoic acid export membrane protein